MRILFSILSVLYIAAIFILAGSHLVHSLSAFNPHSLLHIPLYAILTSLLVFSMVPIPRRFRDTFIEPGNDSTRSPSASTAGLTTGLLVAGAIALVVGVLDEIHQLSVPLREASASDVLLDVVGIAIALLLCSRFLKIRTPKQTG